MAKKVLSTGTVTIGATEYDITGLKFGRKQDKADATDTGTTAGFKEWLATREESTFSFDMFLDEAVAPPAFGTSGTVTLDFEGMSVTGTGVIDSQDLDGQLDSTMTISCSGYFSGSVTVTPAA